MTASDTVANHVATGRGSITCVSSGYSGRVVSYLDAMMDVVKDSLLFLTGYDPVNDELGEAKPQENEKTACTISLSQLHMELQC